MSKFYYKPPHRSVKDLLAAEDGVTAIEYGLIASSIALAFIAIAILLGDDVGAMFTSLSDAVQSAPGD